MQMYDAIIQLGRTVYRTIATGLCFPAKCANIIRLALTHILPAND